MDDGILVTLGHPILRKVTSTFVKHLIWALAIPVKLEKSNLEGTTIHEWIGYIIDLEKMELKCPPKHVAQIRTLISSLLSKSSTTPKELARIKGKIMSKRHALPFASPFTASINVALADEFIRQVFIFKKPGHRLDWDLPMPIPIEVKDDLRVFLNILRTSTSLPIFHWKWDWDLY
ncbi:MAG: hypothetical protein GY950_23005, partial [bacterium]|nr:hypothetical protein [bacterium]